MNTTKATSTKPNPKQKQTNKQKQKPYVNNNIKTDKQRTTTRTKKINVSNQPF